MIFKRIDPDHARRLLAHMVGVPKWDVTDGLCGYDDLMGGAVPFLVTDAGREVAVFMVEKVDRENGKELLVRAAWQLASEGDLTERAMPLIIDRLGYDCRAVTLYTRRAGLVAKLKKSGFHEAGKIMRKMI